VPGCGIYILALNYGYVTPPFFLNVNGLL
jgi:hypothetical protein